MHHDHAIALARMRHDQLQHDAREAHRVAELTSHATGAVSATPARHRRRAVVRVLRSTPARRPREA